MVGGQPLNKKACKHPCRLFLLPLVLLHLVHQVDNLHPGLGKHGQGVGTVVVFSLAHYPLYAAVDDEHGTGAAGGHAAVEGCPLDGDAILGGLADGVLLGMDSADTVLGDGAILVYHLLHLVAHLVAMGQASRGAHIASHQDAIVLGYDAAGAPPPAGGPLCHRIADFHKIVIPVGTLVGYILF